MELTGLDAALRDATGLLVDLDGTLVDSEPLHRRAYRDYFAGRGWDVPDDVVRQFAGRRAVEVFPVLDGPWAGEDPEALTAGVLDVLARATDRPEAVAGAAELLAACARTGVPVCVVTSARLSWALPALDLLGVPPGSLRLVTAEDCTHGKPDPEPFRRGAQALGLAPAGLVALEDSPAGIASARAAGVGLVLGVRTTQPDDVLRAAGADVTSADLTALAAAVEAR
ncbi:HAD family phosphatase [Cellulomonas cellasea]|uniref:Sugar-phosphatase n=1 Tax=Cellulomonas cellasea TaxID=43670 RepID=A0A7W4UEJ7_9CELL|nr:HAD family phosphatase [Cellulomonas cellasea]MBB2922755.1 sugar-phosphatase [Cellulomonas cellasea]